MKHIFLITCRAIMILLIGTRVFAQETAEIPNITELKNLIEQGLLRVYGQHYVNRQDTGGQVKIIDFAYDPKLFKAFVPSDSLAAGRVAADGLAAAITAIYGKPEGDVALITAINSAVSDQRTKGFKDQIAAKYPNLNLVSGKIADDRETTAVNAMANLIAANPNLRGVFAPNPVIAQGAGLAIAEHKVFDKINLVAFDSEDKPVKLVKAGVGDLHTYALKRQNKGDTASGVVLVREKGVITIDINPCHLDHKDTVTFVMPYTEKQISDANCGNNTYPRSQVIQH
jgi:hypothetical protein